MSHGYVYALVDPRRDRVFYVGATTDVRRRLQSHVNDALRYGWVRDFKNEVLRSLTASGMRPGLIVLDEVEHAPEGFAEALSSKERAWAECLGRFVGQSQPCISENKKAPSCIGNATRYATGPGWVVHQIGQKPSVTLMHHYVQLSGGGDHDAHSLGDMLIGIGSHNTREWHA